MVARRYWGRSELAALAIFLLLAGSPPLNAEEKTHSEILVEMAYGAELAGQPSVRDALIEEVLRTAPDNQKARALAGHVKNGGQWATASELERSRSTDKALLEYAQRRETCEEDAKSQLKLANWCRDHGFSDRERLHLAQLVLQHGPDPLVMSRLGMVRFRGQWIHEENLEEFRQQDDRQRRIEKKWRPVFAQWKDDLQAGDQAACEQLVKRLNTVDEGDALPILEEMLSAHDEKAAMAVVERLDAMPLQAATDSLLRHLVFSESEAVQTAAAAALKKRPKYNYIPSLLAALVDPLQIEVQYPYGNTGYRRTTTTQTGPDYNIKTVSHESNYITSTKLNRWKIEAPYLAASPIPPLGWSKSVITNTRPVTDTPRRYVEEGTPRTQHNKRLVNSLHRLTGETHDEPEQWRQWWDQYTEYEREEEKPTYERHYHRHRFVNYSRWTVANVYRPATSCLASGTPVATETGSRPVEQIFPGDKVLAQDPETGELQYKVVNQRTVRQLGEMRRVSIGDDSITVTLGHPFWVIGKGWQMAKELEIGQRVRGLGTSAEITAIENRPADVAYNLVVDEFATYFAGTSRILLHDNTLPEPTHAILPGFVPIPPE